jgi:integrase
VPDREAPAPPIDSPAPVDAAETAAVDPKVLATLELIAEDYASASRADSTLDTYVRHWNAFVQWCAAHGCTPLPATAQTLVFYLASRADKGTRPATLSVALSAVAYEHERAGHPSPTDHRDVKKTWRGIRRRLGTAAKKKGPLSAADLQRMMEELPPGLIGVRDRALLLLGFAGGFRRSELVALQNGHLRFASQGFEALVEKSKTDQEQRGHVKVIAYGGDPTTCPVRAVKSWLERSGIVEGPVFRPINRHEQLGARALTGHAVAAIVKRTAADAGLPTPELSGHSLRAGFVTAAASGGADYPSIMDQTGHESLNTVHGYNRRKDKWKKPASAKLGL